MNSLFSIQHPETFQGKLKQKSKNYFEGWYFKHVSNDCCFSVIPGIHIDNYQKKAFIQVITEDTSYYISYPYSTFHFSSCPFFITLGNSFFSTQRVHLDLQDKSSSFSLQGDLSYSPIHQIQTSCLSPNIMGPFSYVPFLECHHGILSMKHSIHGSLCLNDQSYHLFSGIGYIEKDWGTSFPSSYTWCEANCFPSTKASFFLSIATIPLSYFQFTGIICSLILGEKEYRFATYNHTKLLDYTKTPDHTHIVLSHHTYQLEVICFHANSFCLKAPVKGRMEKEILETINSKVEVTLSQKSKVLFHETSSHGGFESVI